MIARGPQLQAVNSLACLATCVKQARKAAGGGF
jgi:hypothetical protein